MLRLPQISEFLNTYVKICWILRELWPNYELKNSNDTVARQPNVSTLLGAGEIAGVRAEPAHVSAHARRDLPRKLCALVEAVVSLVGAEDEQQTEDRSSQLKRCKREL